MKALQDEFKEASHSEQSHFFEFVIQEAIKEFCKPGTAAIDAGAAGGSHTWLMAQTTGPAGQVHAFEPNPVLADYTRKLCEHYPWLQVHQLALSDRTGDRTFYTAVNAGMGMGSLSKRPTSRMWDTT